MRDLSEIRECVLDAYMLVSLSSREWALLTAIIRGFGVCNNINDMAGRSRTILEFL